MTITTKYDMRFNPVYQIDCQAAASGKWVAATKRRIRWRFGFSHRPSLEKGLTGTACRGEEHEVVLVWSILSGKQLVLADGEEIFFQSTAGYTGTMEASWTMDCGHQVKVVAYAAPAISESPGFRQFDLLIDGLSFYDMPRIYELGQRNEAPLPAHQSFEGEYRNYEEPSAAMNFARSPEFGSSMPKIAPPAIVSDKRELVHQEPAMERSKSLPQIDLLSEGPGMTDFMSSPSAHTAPPMLSSPTSVVDEFAPKPQTYFEQFQDKASAILSAYGGTPTSQSSTGGGYFDNMSSVVPYAPFSSPQPVSCNQYTPAQPPVQYQDNHCEQNPVFEVTESNHNNNTAASLSMQPLEIRDLDARDDMVPMEKAVHDLVHLDDISKPLESPQHKVSKERRDTAAKHKSKPLPPTQAEWFLTKNASLADIRDNKATRSNGQPSKPVMRTHAFDPQAAQAGMLVVHGSTQYYQPEQPQYQQAGMHANAAPYQMQTLYAGY